MKKWFNIVCTLVFLQFVGLKKTYAVINESDNIVQSKTSKYIKFTYDQISFKKFSPLNFEVFSKAFYGYLNMREEGKLKPGALLMICDFSLSSNANRMWVIDVNKKKVLFNTLVAHGQGTGEEYAVAFSNINDSHQSSLGFYVTGETYEGNNGYSLKLHGVDGKFNDNAYDRAIVIHGAEYVSQSFASANKRIGRSHGCPALPVDMAPKIIDKIKDGHCLFIFSKSAAYLTSSYWINNKIKSLPEDADYMDLKMPVKNNPRYIEPKETIEDLADKKLAPSSNDIASVDVPEMDNEGHKSKPKVEVQTTIIKKEDLKNFPEIKIDK